MRFNPIVPSLLGAACLLLASDIRALAQTDYRADARTVVSTTENLLTNRLYRTTGTLAPTNTAIWFVADTSRDGVPTNPPANAILGPDDRLIHQDAVDGQVLGNQAGRFQRTGILVSGVVSTNADIYVYLWDGDGVDFQPQPGSRFGLLKIGIAPAPEIGNAQWPIAENLVANVHTVGDAVLLGPQITVQPTNTVANVGETVELVVVAGGTPPLSYQWYRGGVERPGATNSVLRFEPVALADDGVYTVRVSNSVTNALSVEARLIVNGTVSPPTLSGVTSVLTGTTLVLQFQFDSAAGSTYQLESTTNLVSPVTWKNEGNPVPGSGGTQSLSVTNDVQASPIQFLRLRAN
jgi:hypothetical protein